MTPKIPNQEKILIVLKEIDCSIETNDLATATGINVKNIGRYLDQLVEKKFISRKSVQEGKKRFIMNKILMKGKNHGSAYTIEDLRQELTETNEIKESNPSIINEISFEGNEINDITEETMCNDLSYLNITEKDSIKTELLGILKVIAIRDVDAKRLGLNGKQQLTDKIISLILKL